MLMLRVATGIQKTRLLLGLLAALSSTSLAAGISATATLSETPASAGAYNYALTLNNTGTTTIGTFWFGWVPGAGFLTVAPTTISSPAGWTERSTNAGLALQWTTTTSLLAPGQSLGGFNFTSTETPSQFLGTYPGTATGVGAGDPDLTSFVYLSTPLGDPGSQFVVTQAAPTVTPEPGSLLLTVTGFGMAAASLRSRLFRKS